MVAALQNIPWTQISFMKYSLFLLLFSCSFFIDRFDKDLLEEKGIATKSTMKQTHCEIIQKNIYLAENKNSIDQYKILKDNLAKRIPLSFIDQVVLWSFVQMNVRPDLSSPTSKYQVFLRIDDEDYFYNSFSKDNTGYPQIHLLESLLKEFKSRYSLIDLIDLYDKYFPAQLTVTKDFEAFLAQNQLQIKKNAVLNDFYIRGDETLKQGETLPRISFRKLYQFYKKNKTTKYEVTNFLFESKDAQGLQSSCNFEMSLYKNSIFLINDDLLQAHSFGLKQGKNMFMGASSQSNVQISPVANLPFFQGNSNTRSAAMCHFANEKNASEMWFVSSHSRDPGQHIFHLVEYGLSDIDDIRALDTMVKFSRHQFLKNPVRLVIESRRSSVKQVDELLKLNIPIYNSKKLGKIWGYFRSKKQSSFLLDDRRDGHIECLSN